MTSFTDQEIYEMRQVANAIYKSPKNFKFFKDTVLCEGKTVSQLLPVITKLEKIGFIITYRDNHRTFPPYCYYSINTDNPFTTRILGCNTQVHTEDLPSP